jgi:hypothetical protein
VEEPVLTEEQLNNRLMDVASNMDVALIEIPNNYSGSNFAGCI